MKTENGTLAFTSTLDNSEVLKRLEEIKQKIKGTAQTADLETNNVSDSFKSMARGMAGAFTFAAAAQFRQKLIDVRGEFQKFEAVLKNSLGSESAAAESMQMLTDIASNTPFQLDSLTQSYVKLVNQGFKPTRAELIKLGDLASSTGKGFDQLAEAVLDAQTGQFERLKEFGIKASASGDQIAFSFKGVTTTVQNSNAAIRDYMLSLGDMQGVKGSMEAISKTLVGQVSNLEDSITSMFNKIGSQSEGFLSGSISATKYLVDNYQDVGLAVAGLVAVYGAYKTAVIVVNTLNKIQAATNLVVAASNGSILASEARMIAAKTKLIQLQSAFNASMLSNPYAVVAAAVMATVVATYLVFRNKTIEVKNAMELLKGTQKDVAKGMADQKSKIEPLVETLQNLKVAEKDRLKAYNALNEINPSLLNGISLQEAATSKLTERVKEYLVQAEKKIAYDIYSSKLSEAMAPQLEANDQLNELYKQQVIAIMNLNEAKKKFGENSVAAVRAGGIVGGLNFQIKETIEAWKKAEESVKIIKDKMAGYVPEDSTVKVEPPKQESKDKADFDKLLDYKQKKYEEYFDWARAFGSGSANEEFKSLISEGKSFEEFLQNSINSLESKKSTITAAETKRLSVLRGYYAKVILDQSKVEITPIGIKKANEVKSDQSVQDVISANEMISKHELQTISENSEHIIEFSKKELSTFMDVVGKKIKALQAEGEEVKWLQDIYDKANATFKSKTPTIAQDFIDVATILDSVAIGLEGANKDLADMVGLAANLAGNLGNAVKELQSKDGNKAAGVAGVIGVIASFVDKLDKMFGLQKKEADNIKERIDYNSKYLGILNGINIALDEQYAKLEQLKGVNLNLGYEQTFADLNISIQKAKDELSSYEFDFVGIHYDKGQDHIFYRLDQFRKILNSTATDAQLLNDILANGGITQEDYDLAKQYLDAIDASRAKQNELQAKFNERLTGTTESSIVDSIAEGFRNGESSMVDFTDNFQELMQDALIQSFKAKALEGPISQFYKDFAAMSKDGLTSSEVAGLQKMYSDIISGANAMFEGLTAVSGISFNKGGSNSPESTLTGAIKGVTEETASLVAGQMNAMRMNQAEGLEVMRSSLFHLANIDANTHSMSNDIADIKREIVSPNINSIP